jgi:hypothetical protein
MLSEAKNQGQRPGQPDVIPEDRSSSIRQQRFGLVLMTRNALSVLFDRPDIAALFAKVHALLGPGGVFIFDTRLPAGL